MSELPKNWCTVEIEQVLQPLDNGKVIQQGWSPQCEKHPASSEEWGVLKTTAVQEGYFLPDENKKLPNSLDPRPAIEIKAGDILMTCAGPRNRCGVTSFVKKTRPRLMMSGKMYRFRADPQKIDPSYLEAFLLSQDAKVAIDRMKTGINDSGLNLTHSRFLKLIVPLAPIREQQRILSKIEELFSELDKGIESLKTARAQLKIYRQAVLKHAFEQYVGNKTTLGKLLSYVTSGSRGWADYYSDVGDTFIRAQNLKYDRLDLTECAYVSLPNKTEGTRTRVQNGDLLITITGANVTKSALVESDLGTAYVSQHVALCRPIKDVLPKFLYWFIVAESAGRKQLTTAAYGAGKPGLNLDNIKSVQINIPPYDRQVSTVEIIEIKLDLFFK
jgi:restriction endonuclease S subunit